MQNLKVHEFRKLLFESDGPCVSLYLDGLNSVDSTSAARLEGLIAKAAKSLKANNLHEDPDFFLQPARDLLEKNASRLAGRVGVGIFVSRTTQAFVCLPSAPKERVVIAGSFHLKPIMKALASGVESFAVLVLSVRGAQFFDAEHGAVKIQHDVPLDKRTRAVIESSEAASDGRAMLRQYLRRVDRAARAWMGRGRRPLILAGPAYLRAVYRETNTYPYLIPEGFALEAPFRIDFIHSRAAQVLSNTIESSITYDLSELRDAASDPNVTFDIKTASKWVAMGVVSKIFVAEDAILSGTFDSTTGEVALRQAVGTDCVLDDLAEEVLRRGGRVVCVPQSGLPKRSLLAAVKETVNRPRSH